MELTGKLQKFLQQSPETPFLAVDLDLVAAQYQKLQKHFDFAQCYYSVKANPAPEVLQMLVALGAAFETASFGEIEQSLGAGARPEQILFGNTIKKTDQIRQAFAAGVRQFVFDGETEVHKLAKTAPGSRVYCRLKAHNSGAVWPLTRKFGCSEQRAVELMVIAQKNGLVPHGISFHVGSQQKDPQHWQEMILSARRVGQALGERGITIRSLNIGGGFPAQYRNPVPPIEHYAAAIRAFVGEAYGQTPPAILMEPGRHIVAEAGVIVGEVLLIRHDPESPDKRWVYLDIGRFNGLMEAGTTEYRIVAPDRDGPETPVVLAGPTCDSADILSNDVDYRLPVSLKVGDRIHIQSGGAYTTTYASIGFNGFEPMRDYYI